MTAIRPKFRATRRAKAPAVEPAPRAALQFALAHAMERLVEDGEVESYADIARQLGITRARMTQLGRLLLLAPAIQEQLLVGELRGTERSLRRASNDPDWMSQICIVDDA